MAVLGCHLRAFRRAILTESHNIGSRVARRRPNVVPGQPSLRLSAASSAGREARLRGRITGAPIPPAYDRARISESESP